MTSGKEEEEEEQQHLADVAFVSVHQRIGLKSNQKISLTIARWRFNKRAPVRVIALGEVGEASQVIAAGSSVHYMQPFRFKDGQH